AGDQEPIVGIVRARGPDLLAVDDPVVALLLGAGTQARNVGAAGRLGEELAPDLLPRGELRQIAALVVLAAIGHHGRAEHALADLEGPGQFAVDALFLLPDHALDRRCATAAIFLRPVQASPAGFRLLLLPGLADLDHVVMLQADAAERRFRELRLQFPRRIGLDPFARDVAEFGFLRGVIEIHRYILSAVIPGRAERANAESRSTISGFSGAQLRTVVRRFVAPRNDG